MMHHSVFLSKAGDLPCSKIRIFNLRQMTLQNASS